MLVILLQKALRRSPLEECPDTLTLLHALRAAIASHQRVLATHLGLAAAVRLLRSPEWPPEQLLARVGAALAAEGLEAQPVELAARRAPLGDPRAPHGHHKVHRIVVDAEEVERVR